MGSYILLHFISSLRIYEICKMPNLVLRLNYVMSKNLFELISIEPMLQFPNAVREGSLQQNRDHKYPNRNLNLEHLVERLTLNRLNQDTAKITIR